MWAFCIFFLLFFSGARLSEGNTGERNRKHAPVSRSATNSHTVKKGETLYGLSLKYKIPLQELCRINGIAPAKGIKAGERLKIPGNKAESSRVADRNKKLHDTRSDTAKEGSNPVFLWPLKRVIEYKKDQTNGVKSIGITITGQPGAAVHSSAKGVVRRIGHMRGYGNYVVILHSDRFATVYANMDKINVREGERIASGMMIGRIDSAETTLHFQIDHQGKPTNPLKYLP